MKERPESASANKGKKELLGMLLIAVVLGILVGAIAAGRVKLGIPW